MAQSPQRFMSVTLLSRSSDPIALTATVRNTVAAIDQDLPIYHVNSLAGAIHTETWFYRLFGGVFIVFGFVALFLASVGLYGVMSFSVKQRTREVGIRMALGAQVRDVLKLIMRQGFTQIAIGLAFGLSLAVGVSQGVQLVLFQVNPRDPGVFAGVVVTLLITGLVACFIPALRAARVDPLVALRSE
jgi:ABC-type antimicrobial peptide transport system permease subunit